MLRLSLIMILAIGIPAHAQDREGNDTASDWVVSHSKYHGIWETICDERASEREGTKRCYIRVVDVFSARPKFGAIFFFLTIDDAGYELEFGLEPGTLFDPNGFRIEDWAHVTWQTQRPGCLTGITCVFAGEAAAPLLDALEAPGALILDFVDRHGQKQMLEWSNRGFEAALEDFHTQRQLRHLE